MAKKDKKIFVFTQISNNIEVKVAPIFLDEESSRLNNKFVWAYHVQIYNRSEKPVQVMKRHWTITDGHGKTHEVHGDGVIGEKPTIQPHDMFEYTSAVPLQTPSGFMKGSYEVLDEDGTPMNVGIPCFSLDSPFAIHGVH